MDKKNNNPLTVSVKCHSGYKANEYPVSFSFRDKLLNVITILDRWYGPDYSYFKLKADDGNLYILKYHQKTDRWELHFFEMQTPE